VVLRVLERHLRDAAGLVGGTGQGGAVTLIQRIGSAANPERSPGLPGAGRGVLQ